jgi:hypothetical protein
MRANRPAGSAAGLAWRTSYTDGASLPASAFGGLGGAETCFKLDVLDASAYTLAKQPGGGFLLQPRGPAPAPAAAAAGVEAPAAAAAAGGPAPQRKRKRQREGASGAAAPCIDGGSSGSGAPAPAAAAAATSTLGPKGNKRKRAAAAAAAAASAAAAAGEGGAAGEGSAEEEGDQAAPAPALAQQQQQQQQHKQQQKQRPQAPQQPPAPRASALGPRDSAPALPAQGVAATWAPFCALRPELLANLARLRYGAPTAVQRSVLPQAITNFKDIVATAATGSGKTAAYALPLLQRLLDRREASGMGTAAPAPASAPASAPGQPPHPPHPHQKRWATLPALVLVPTRELALQVRDHINALAQGTCVRAVAIVGGLAQQKQERLVRARPDILVATPGRLAELMGSPHVAPFLSMDLSTLQLLVLDEADRMVDKGSFESLRVIFAALRGERGVGVAQWMRLQRPLLSR